MGTRHVNSYLCRAYKQDGDIIVATVYLAGIPNNNPEPKGVLIATETIEATDAFTAKAIFLEHIRNDKLAHDASNLPPGEK